MAAAPFFVRCKLPGKELIVPLPVSFVLRPRKQVDRDAHADEEHHEERREIPAGPQFDERVLDVLLDGAQLAGELIGTLVDQGYVDRMEEGPELHLGVEQRPLLLRRIDPGAPQRPDPVLDLPCLLLHEEQCLLHDLCPLVGMAFRAPLFIDDLDVRPLDIVRSVADHAMRTFARGTKGLPVAALQVVLQDADVAFSAELGDLARRRGADKAPLVRHGHRGVLRVAAVAVVAGNVVLGMPALLPLIGDVPEGRLHLFRGVAVDAGVLLDPLAHPGLGQELPGEILLVSCRSERGEAYDHHHGQDKVPHQDLPQNMRMSHRMKAKRKRTRSMGRFMMFFSFSVSKNGQRRKRANRTSWMMIPKNLFGMILSS